MAEDRELFRIDLPWPLPDLVIMVVKSGSKGRWTIFFRLHTGEAKDGAYYFDFTWWLQLRAWWPPLMFYRGWVRRG